MRGLLGKKLGMTQLFDEESGGVTPVTVIEAGPCPVVAVRTPDADGYEAVQLAWEPVAERKLSKGELGHLAKAGIGGTVRMLGTVQTNGRVTNCRVIRSSGVSELDGLTCRLIEQRFVYRPATDRNGRPVTDQVEIEWTWD